MDLELTTWERIMLIVTTGSLRGPVALARQAGKLLDVLEFSPEQRAEIGLVIAPNGMIGWAGQHDTRTWSVQVKNDLIPLLRNAVQGFEGWTARDLPRLDELMAKLGA
jgi:hypothetical protein